MDRLHYNGVTSLYRLDLTTRIVKIRGWSVEGGTLGDVYKCHLMNGSNTTEVAVKAFRFKFTPDGVDNSAKILRRDLYLWTKLDHKNIVPFFGVAHGFGMRSSISFVSLWMPNGTLQSLLEIYDNWLAIRHRLHLIMDIANGLDYLHSFSSPIVHGDLNPNNILLDANFNACLTDFGQQSSIGATSEALAYLRRSTRKPGSIRWIAPEQVRCNSKEKFRKTTMSDVYSFGSLSLLVLSGKPPWSDILDDTSIALYLARGQKPEQLKSRQIDKLHWDFINACWSPIQEHRPTSRHIVSTVAQLLSQHSHVQSIRDLIVSLPRQC